MDKQEFLDMFTECIEKGDIGMEIAKGHDNDYCPCINLEIYVDGEIIETKPILQISLYE